MPGEVGDILQKTYKPVTEIFKAAESAFEKTKDLFSPEFPEIEKIDPVTKQAVLPSMQAEERSLLNRAGLRTTKKVDRSLLRQKSRQTLGGGGS